MYNPQITWYKLPSLPIMFSTTPEKKCLKQIFIRLLPYPTTITVRPPDFPSLRCRTLCLFQGRIRVSSYLGQRCTGVLII